MISKLFFISLAPFLFTSCANQKSFQCQKILQIATNVTKETRSLTTDKSSENIDKKTWLLAADKIEQGSEDLKKLAVNDPNLQQYKTSFAQVYQDYADATRQIIKVLDSKDKEAAKAAQEKVRKAAQLEKEVGSKFNIYCKN
ncbi:MAG: hypothetical protein Cpurp_14215 [Chlorogloea purpurea SAG 13.99]|nr:hypothetical protein [Chlorogloea purpurea SAG 13.99]